MIINAEDLILGRLASFTAKKALLGETIIIVNSEKAVITGNKDDIEAGYKQRGTLTDPFQGPFYPYRPDRLLRRTIRGMLPWSKDRGRDAYKRVECYIGIPDRFKDKKLETVERANISKTKNLRYITLEKVSRQIGWK